MTIEELAKEIADALSPRLTVDGIYHVIRWTLERYLPKLTRPPMSREEAEQYARTYIATREKRHRENGIWWRTSDEATIREDFIAALTGPPPKEPRYEAEPYGLGCWRVVGQGAESTAYFYDPDAMTRAKAYADWLNTRKESK